MEPASASQELEQRLGSQNLLALVDKYRGRESKDNFFQRFLVARDSDVEKAFELLKADLEWRENQNTLQYHNVPSRRILEINGSLAGKAMLDTMLPVSYLGKDRQGRPVIYRKIAAPVDAAKLTKETEMTYEHFVKYNIWILERMTQTMEDQGQWLSIMDLSEFAFRHLTKLNLQWAKVLADLMKDHYPERLGKSMLINAPTVFNMGWAIAKTWLDARTKEKVGIFGGEKAWKPEMEKIMDLSILPVELGGNARLSFDPHSLDPRTHEAGAPDAN
eukprot:CAMPEP_0181297832 /NCGR_PEP_ID=MMETSP1101-20121128/5457_1 /TAXON_ID=46948 /ORGANISM="Rhodomonas abbreviata, Strain Caron Lab Isolate" /LENGTH=274 /DNA_ID=CAMNT_0023402809 /DNA_START=89 /DNA_END=913 /DNA_ORIENTATION=+